MFLLVVLIPIHQIIIVLLLKNNPIENVAVAIPPCNDGPAAASLESSVQKVQTISVSNKKQQNDVPNNITSVQHQKLPAATIIPCTTRTTTDPNHNVDDTVTKTTNGGIVTNGTSTQHSTLPNLTNNPIEHFTAIIPSSNIPTASSTHADGATDPFVPELIDCCLPFLNNTQKDIPNDNCMPPTAPIIYISLQVLRQTLTASK